MSKLIEVHWLDPWSPTETWIDVQDLKDYAPKPHVTVGYVVPLRRHGLGKSWLVLAGTLSGTEHLSGVTCIPKSLIIKRRRID